LGVNINRHTHSTVVAIRANGRVNRLDVVVRNVGGTRRNAVCRRYAIMTHKAARNYEPLTQGAIILKNVDWWAKRWWYCAWIAPKHRDKVDINT